MEGNELDRLDETLTCPLCGAETRSLKQYRVMRWCVFYLVGSIWQVKVVRACPSCMRAVIWKSALINLVPANLLWLLLILPWTMILTLMTLVEGPSRAILEGVTPSMVVAREMQGRELKMGRVLAVLALIFCWIPLIGLVLGAMAAWTNWRETGWTRPVSLVAFSLSGLFHLFLVALFVWETIQFGF